MTQAPPGFVPYRHRDQNDPPRAYSGSMRLWKIALLILACLIFAWWVPDLQQYITDPMTLTGE